jgi:hypothetical protein
MLTKVLAEIKKSMALTLDTIQIRILLQPN